MKRGLSPMAILLTPLLFSMACAYIVLPEGLESSTTTESRGWRALATKVSSTQDGVLHVDLTLRNETGDWSAMNAVEGSPAVLHAGGEDRPCDTVFVGTGGHRVAPGFQLRGYPAGTEAEPETQLIYVECAGVAPVPGASITIDYTYVTGQYNYYEQDKGRIDASLEIEMDPIAEGLTYPVGETVDGLIQDPATPMEAINRLTLELADVRRTDGGLEFTWKTTNPGDYPSYVHIGNPPVLGEDGILYGLYETPDIVSVPITSAGGSAEWKTKVAVPADVRGLYILLSVETGKARLFANYAIDISDR